MIRMDQNADISVSVSDMSNFRLTAPTEYAWVDRGNPRTSVNKCCVEISTSLFMVNTCLCCIYRSAEKPEET